VVRRGIATLELSAPVGHRLGGFSRLWLGLAFIAHGVMRDVIPARDCGVQCPSLGGSPGPGSAAPEVLGKAGVPDGVRQSREILA
jgi:hypothetical protein